MILWLDAQLSPLLAEWITAVMDIEAVAIRDLGLRDAKDFDIFMVARAANAVVLTKDIDFPQFLNQHGPPPKILWLTCGNTSNQSLKNILNTSLPKALKLIYSGESLVEIR